MDLGLAGKTALVLGASGGLGGAIAAELAREGARVAVASRSAERAQAVARQIADAGGEALPVSWDLGDLAAIDGAVSTVEDRYGPVNVLVNNTGGPPPTPAHGQDPALWREHFTSMVLSVIALTDRVLPGMRAGGWGRIITSTSSGIISPIPNLGLSNSLRLALTGWSKTLAREVAGEGITVNVLVPGRIATRRTRMLDTARAEREKRPMAEVVAESLAAIPAGRYGEPREYAQVAAFLAGECASYVTGSVIRVDGGLIAGL
ncbi:SDR family oxidoreductase [Thermopolyspora sp. NPDC052614]|uniref:SDR family oxidoreductase n=1 Tax=Thermopolyspora sp. NPDC052614 TaxID=3155682 RepID=UPI0034469DA9